jgi:glucokinase
VKLFLGIDIGGTTVRVGAFRSLNDVEAFDDDLFPVEHNYAKDFEGMMGASVFLRDYNQEHAGPVEGIGLAIAGVLDADRTTLAKAGNTVQWVGQPFIQELRTYFGCPVAFGNDAEAAAMAEAMYGNPEGGDFWFVIWGTGVGGTLVRYVDGKPIAFAGEMGHLRVSESNSRICACGQFSCLEAYCGGAKIREYVGVAAEELNPAQWEEVLAHMVIGLRGIATSQPVGRIYFGGGIAAKQSHFIPELEDLLRMDLQIVDAPEMALSRFGESAGTVGALALLKSTLA